MKESIYLIIYSLAILWCIVLSNRKWAKIDKKSFEKSKWLRNIITGLVVAAFVCGVVGRVQGVELLGVPSFLELILYAVAALSLGTGFAVIIFITMQK